MRDWKPRRRGRIYCAPACGGDCTLAEHDKAQRTARRIARLLGKGWRVEVWENLGWHWRVTNGPVQLGACYAKGRKTLYHAMVGSSPTESRGGAAYWTERGQGYRADPRRAVKDAVRLVEKFVAGAIETRDAARRAAGSSR